MGKTSTEAKKPNYGTPEEAKELLGTTKEELATAKEEFKTFRKENSIGKDDDMSTDAKLGKKFTKYQSAVEKKQAEVDAIKEYLKSNKTRKVREVKYDYPEGMTDAEKKKFRAAARKEAAKAESGEEVKPKKGKKSAPAEETTEEATDEASKKSKKSKKDKKKAKTSTED